MKVSRLLQNRLFKFNALETTTTSKVDAVANWNRLASLRGRPIILAGGLSPDNIDRAVSTLKPYALDVSGGVEAAPGIKSSKLVQLFVDRCSKA